MYVPSIHCDSSSKKEWKNVFYSVLNESRKKDIETGFSSLGPHRDDIRFFLDQKSAKTFGSQGQCRSIALSLKLSSILCIETYRQDGMIFLVDDAVSELDKYRTSKVYPLIENKGQIFIATPVFDSLANKSLLRCIVADGKVVKR
jgi:DNA replication and repair protein RecF